MNTLEVNQELACGAAMKTGVLPKLDQLVGEPFVFKMDFGLDALPAETGVILIRGARQYGKARGYRRKCARPWNRADRAQPSI